MQNLQGAGHITVIALLTELVAPLVRILDLLRLGRVTELGLNGSGPGRTTDLIRQRMPPLTG